MYAAAAAAKSLQSRPTLCDPTDGSPPGSPVPGILQARILEWVAIYVYNCIKTDLPSGSDGKASAYNAGRPRFNPLVRKIPWKRKWQSTPVFLPVKIPGWRSEPGRLQSMGSQRVRHD